MHATMTPETITLQATLDELRTWEAHDLAVFATPADEDHRYALQVYLASRPTNADDFCLATSEDFANAAGLDIWGFQEWTEDEWNAWKDDLQTCTISRLQQIPILASPPQHGGQPPRKDTTMTEAEIIAALGAIRTGSPAAEARNYAVGLLLGFLATVGHPAVVRAFCEARERVPFEPAQGE